MLMCEARAMTLEEAKEVQLGDYVRHKGEDRKILGKSERNPNEIGFFLYGLVTIDPIVPFYECRKIPNPS